MLQARKSCRKMIRTMPAWNSCTIAQWCKLAKVREVIWGEMSDQERDTYVVCMHTGKPNTYVRKKSLNMSVSSMVANWPVNAIWRFSYCSLSTVIASSSLPLWCDAFSPPPPFRQHVFSSPLLPPLFIRLLHFLFLQPYWITFIPLLPYYIPISTDMHFLPRYFSL